MGNIRFRPVLFAASLALAVFPATYAWAHSFGVRYDAPLPLWLYLAGAGAAVALSFAVMALFLGRRRAGLEAAEFDLLSLTVLKWLGGPAALNGIRVLSVAIFALVLAAGLFGNPDPFKNIAPTFIWVVWWVGMAFISILAGNLWDLVNPWKILFTWVARFRGGAAAPHPYPDWLGRWPALLLFLIFAWMELISEQAEQPRVLATLIIAYSALAWAGMEYYGRDAWLRHGDAFTVAFGLLARFAISHGGDGQWRIRPPAVGLLCRDPVPVSGVCFVLLLLTSVTFDGILETPLWTAILTWISESQALRPALLAMQDSGADLIAVIKTVALTVLPVIFIAVFMAASKAIAWAGGGAIETRQIAGYFVLSLVPIAIAYHLSHYLSYLLIAGQNIIPMLSDPFGRGWDLFGTTVYAIDLGIVNAEMIWMLAVSSIIAGHVLAIYIAHVMAIRVFENRIQALRSQIPMLFLMVGYTMISLWILSQPVLMDGA